MAGFELDKNALKKIADEAVKKVMKEAQPHFDRLHREHKGKPIAEVEPHVRTMIRQLGWTADASDIRSYAKATADGDRIVLRAGDIKM